MKVISLLLATLLVLGAPLRAQDSATLAKAKTIVVPKVDFRDGSVREVLEFLTLRAKALDPGHEGINIIYKTPVAAAPAGTAAAPAIPGPLDGAAAAPAPAPAPAAGGRTVTLTMQNVPVSEVLKYVADLTDCTVRWDPNAVVISAPVDQRKVAQKPRPEASIGDKVNIETTVKPLQTTKIPKIDFREATVSEAFDFLGQISRKLLPGGKGVNFVLNVGEAKDRRVTLSGTDLSIVDAARYVAELAGLDVTIEEFAVVVTEGKK